MTTPRWIDRSPNAYAYRAVHQLPEWCRWGLAWVTLIGAMAAAWLLLVIVLGAPVGLT